MQVCVGCYFEYEFSIGFTSSMQYINITLYTLILWINLKLYSDLNWGCKDRIRRNKRLTFKIKINSIPIYVISELFGLELQSKWIICQELP